MARTIGINPFSSLSIKNAIQELEQYKVDLSRKCDEFCSRLALRISEYVQAGFQASVSDTRINGVTIPVNVNVSIQREGNMFVVIARGEDAVWAEFGAGVYYNTPAGSSPHPQGAKLGMVIGGYGNGYGAQKTWGYISDDGELILTHGTPATMPMFNALQRILGEYESIACEVFG